MILTKLHQKKHFSFFRFIIFWFSLVSNFTRSLQLAVRVAKSFYKKLLEVTYKVGKSFYLESKSLSQNSVVCFIRFKLKCFFYIVFFKILLVKGFFKLAVVKVSTIQAILIYQSNLSFNYWITIYLSKCWSFMMLQLLWKLQIFARAFP